MNSIRVMTTNQNKARGSLHGDRPIKKRAEDKLRRAGFARSIAAQIQRAPRGESFVMGLLGPWGSGKTSILNLIEEELSWDSSIVFLWFNPWLFSGHQQLVAHFFQEIAAQLRDNGEQDLRDVWRGFEGYSRLLRPLRAVPGPDGHMPVESREPSVRRQRKMLEDALEGSRYRLVIAIDDLDRLEDDEIRDIMRVVRLLADFPNTIYLLSYDQERVEEALGETRERGRAYLEKIVQVTHMVPAIRESDLATILAGELNQLLESVPHLLSSQPYLLDVYHQGIRPICQGLRDIYRYINALRPTLEQIGDEITLPDILALEVLRVLEPGVFTGLIERASLLTSVNNGWGSPSRTDHANRDASRQALFALGGRRAQQVQKLLNLIFPGAEGSYGPEWLGTWRKERRVAHPEVLQIYIERVLPEGAIHTRTVRAFVDSVNDEQALSNYLASMNSEQLEQLFQRLEDYEHDIRLQGEGVAVKVLLEQLPRLREGTAKFFDVGGDMALMRIVLRLLRNLDKSRCLEIVEHQLPRIPSISSRSILVHLVKEHNLVEPHDATRLTDLVIRQIIEATPLQLASERSLIRLLYDVRAHDEIAMSTKFRELAMVDAGLVRMLTSGLSESRSAAAGSVVASVEYVLSWWDDLERIVGATTIKERIHALDARRSELGIGEREARALDTALQYLSGWRPDAHKRLRTAAAEDDAAEDDAAEDDAAEDDAAEDDAAEDDAEGG